MISYELYYFVPFNGSGFNYDHELGSTVPELIHRPGDISRVKFIKYIRWMNAVWNVTNVEVLYPRLILTIGDVYNGPVVKE